MTRDEPSAENEELRRRLEEAEETLLAIRTGTVDAFVVGDGGNERVFTLEGADRPYRLLVERMAQGAVTLHADGTIVYANRRLADLLAVPHERLIGAVLREFVRDDEHAAYDAIFARGRTTSGDGELHLGRADGTSVPVLVTFNALPADCGAEVGGLVTDLTVQKHHDELASAHQALRESEAQRRLALEAAETGAWHLDLASMRFALDERCRAIYGIAATELDFEAALELVHADDRERVRDAIAAATRPDDPDPFAVEYRILHSDGAIRWVFAMGRTHAARRDQPKRPRSLDGTLADITARKAAEEEREALFVSERSARAEAERAGRIKDEFLATLSHELRSPLNAILGWTHELVSKSPTDALALKGLSVIERNARLQAQLIADLLDMNRIISGKMRLDVQRVELGGVIDAALESIRPAAHAKGVELLHTGDVDNAAVHGDPGRLQQVVWNLLSNAVKFTPEGGRVLVSLARAGSHFEIAVSDTGIGVKADFLPHVFERFRQADSSAAREHGGLGLGLSIVKQLTEIHGGSVRAASDGEGKGATFTVCLPLSAARLVSADSSEVASRAVVAAPASSALPKLAGVRVLVVDDEDDARDLIRRILEQCGAEVVLAPSAADAEAAVRRERFDAVLSDIGMPVRDGYALMKSLRQGGFSAPAAALTAFARPEDRMRALGAGYQKHIAKPVEPTELLATVAALVNRTAAGP